MKRCLSGLAGLLLAGAATAAEPPAVLDRESVPAAGAQSARLTVSRFGRYSIAATSGQGASLQLVDRMGGPGEAAGEPGTRDGRLDVFLDRGEYKLLARGHRAAGGNTRLSVSPFTERNLPRPPRLTELKLVEGELHDLEQRSYWIEIDERRPVWLEAAGRALADLRLWRDGEWLVETSPDREYVQPKVGQPLFVYRLAAVLDPGLYLLTAYGGPPQPWSDGDAHPFYLRLGIPTLSEPTRGRYTVGPFGIDRYRIAASANFFRLELPEAMPAAARVGTFDPGRPYGDAADAQIEVTKKSVPPAAETELAPLQEGERFIAVRAAAGQPYVLQAFQRADLYEFRRTGTYWISTVHSGDAGDSVDATAILVHRTGTQRPVPMATDVVELDAKTTWSRRANLLGTLTVFFRVKEAVAFTLASKGTAARFRVEPFMIQRPQRYQPPPFRDSGARWDLEAGLFVLTIEPVRKGIVEVSLAPAAAGEASAAPPRASARFGETHLVADQAYTVFVNQRPGVANGLVLRELPLDLTQALPLTLRPEETVSVSFAASEAGRVAAIAEDGTNLSLSVDGGAWHETAAVEPGRHTVAVRGGPKAVVASVSLVPRSADPQSPLPAMPEAALAGIPKWPTVTDAAPRFFDLQREANTSFNVRAEKAGLYRLETTGLLALEGNLRTRTMTSFAKASGNGTGRNALLHQYLREGDYQVTVAALGASEGHAGLVLSRGEPSAGGFLTSGVPARVSLPAGQSVSYRFNITRPGRFRVRAFGLGRTFRCRLEDLDGWPVVTPGAEADLTRDFEPGKYRLVVLPEATDTRVLTVIEPVRGPRVMKGHGPHRLAIAEKVEHVWIEPAEGENRAPDVWEWNVPARVTARLELGGEMQGALARVAEAGASTPVAAVPPGRGWSGTLEPGRYRLEAVCSRRNNRVTYDLALTTEELTAGQDRTVAAPIEVPVSLGEAALVEIGSFGEIDVKARLLDADGRVVARSDDRPDDWNFLLVQHLAAGRYRLRVDPVGAAAGRTRVSFRIPREEEQPALTLPAAAEVTLGRASRLYPIVVPAGAGLLVAEARSATSAGIALEVQDGGAWRAAASALGRRPRIAVRLATVAPHRLRVWSVDRRETPLQLSVVAPATATVTEAQLAKGVSFPPVPGLAAGATRVTFRHAGLFRVSGLTGALWCGAEARACRAQEGDLVAVAREAWLVADVPPGAPPTARAERVSLGADESVTVRLPPDASLACDLRDHDGAVVVTASSAASILGVALVAGEERASPVMAVGAQQTLAAAMGARGQAARVWSASGPAFPVEVTLRARHFPRPREVKAEGGSWEGPVEGGRLLRLADGPKRVRMALGPEGVAMVVDGNGKVRSVHGGEGRAIVETVETDARAVAVFGPPTTRAAIAALPLPQVPAALAAGAPYERRHGESGTVHIPVGPGAGRVHVRGGEGEATFVGAAGHVRRGSDLDVGSEGGALIVPHGTGWVLAWIGDEEGALWGGATERDVKTVEWPSVVNLEQSPRLAVEVRQPTVLHLRSATPLITRLTRAGRPPQVEVHSERTAVDAYLEAGRATIEVRPFGGGVAAASAEVTASAVTPIGDGLGPEVLLAPGTTRVFSFVVPSERPVGVGVRAGSEVVEASLLNDRGEVLARGPSQMRTLTAGTYLLALHAPADSAAVAARPSLVGLALPDTGPREEVVRQYVAPEDTAPSFASTRAEEAGTRGREWYGDPGQRSTEATFEAQHEWESDVPVEGEGEMEGEAEAETEGEPR